MYEVWICFGNKEWKMIGKTDSFIEAEDILLDAYVHRADDFIVCAVCDQFNNSHMRVYKGGKIEQFCRVKWADVKDARFNNT